MRIPILYQDADLVVVAKPAGLPTHAVDPRDPYPGDALRVVQQQTGLGYLGMHQRLDAETSGVLLFSARPEANRALAAAFEGRRARKVYLAWVWGPPPKAEGAIDAPLVRDREGRYRIASANDPRKMTALTRYRVIGSVQREGLRHPGAAATKALMPNRPATLLEVSPETGRPHQIRVHLAHIGCPVIGDPLYGPSDSFPRLCLHAWQITLPHPATGELVTFTAPPPPLFEIAPAAQAKGANRPIILGDKPAPHVRLLAASDPAGLRALLRLAVERRAPLAADPATTIYRLVNAAADGLPGLTVDRYGPVLVASLYDDDARLLPQPIPAALAEVLVEVMGPHAVYVKYRPQQASRIGEDQRALLAPPQPVYGPNLDEFTACEDGLSYVIRPTEGLSVGLFPDMREGRGRVRAAAAGRKVLNTFAYTCGFGVAALAGGAARVLNLDLSKTALAWGQENCRANGFEPAPYDFVFGDVFDWLARLARRKEQFDLVILDPPGFARSKGRVFSAARDYGELTGLAAQVTAPGGLLLACCNVAELPWRTFRERALSGLAAAGRAAEATGIHHEPTLDFPAPRGQEPYLKMFWLQL